MAIRISPFKTFTITEKTDKLVKRSVTIAKRRYMPEGRRITIELDTGWPGRGERSVYRGATVGEFRKLIEDFMSGGI